MIINWLLAVVLVAGIAVTAVSFAEWLRERELNKVIFTVNRIK
jgi:predicted ABC-type exoprotein transport system permease subunit